jgi:hydrogenase nickel incorporation protein HypA/HybF
MHELSLSSAILETVERHAAGRRVSVVSLRVGRLRQVVPDTLAFYFGIVSEGTVCDGARLELEDVPARLACTACGHAWDVELAHFRCPVCASGAVEVSSGQEFEVESIEVEEAPCIAPG